MEPTVGCKPATRMGMNILLIFCLHIHFPSSLDQDFEHGRSLFFGIHPGRNPDADDCQYYTSTVYVCKHIEDMH